jgi:hypothetical protein
MIGTDLNLVLPSTSETMAVNVARIATALSAIEDSIAQLVTPAALDITAPLDMRGNLLFDVASVQFVSGNAQNTAGSIYYYNGDWYVVDSVGTIQLTDAGQLNAASVGGIKGDYGGVNPAAVTFVDSNGQYIFTEDTGVYADIVADDLILKGSAGDLTFAVDAALTGSRAINIKSLPSSGKSLLVYDAATSTLEDNAVTRATNTVNITALDASGNVDAASYTVDVDRLVLVAGAAAASSTATHTFSGTGWTYGASTLGVYYPLTLTVGAVIKGAKVYCSRSAGGSMTLDIMKAGVSLGSQTNNTAGPLSFTLSVTGLSHTVVDDGSAYTLRITTDGTTAQFSNNAVVTVQGKI